MQTSSGILGEAQTTKYVRSSYLSQQRPANRGQRAEGKGQDDEEEDEWDEHKARGTRAFIVSELVPKVKVR